MKKLFLFFVLITGLSNAVPLDTNILKYFPLNVGNRWTWEFYRNFSPGGGYKTMKVLSAHEINNRFYYYCRTDTYIIYGNQHTSGDLYYRLDSASGNLYTYNIQNNEECLLDSLNSQINDSARCGCGVGKWYRFDTSSYNIFNQSYPSMDFGWSNYFEVSDGRVYSMNIGKVFNWYHGAGTLTETETLLGCLINGILYGDTNIYLGVNQISSEVPEKFSLFQNYPNPFNPTTRIRFSIPQTETSQQDVSAKLIVYDALGREVQTLVNENLSPGTYEADFDGSNLPSGVYYYTLSSNSFYQSKKMVLIK